MFCLYFWALGRSGAVTRISRASWTTRWTTEQPGRPRAQAASRGAGQH